jgi:hypothetical protein
LADAAGSGGEGEEEEEDDDDGLPPLEPNTNRRAVEYYLSDSSSECSGG